MSNTQRRVFIVDDDPRVLKSLSRLLRSVDIEAVTFSSPRAFLEQQIVFPESCLVLDLSMPGIDGLQLQKALVEKNETIPIIFLTGHGNIPQAVRAMRSGAVDFLTKPVEDEALLAAIEAALSHARAAWNEKNDRKELQMRIERLTPREREVMAQVVTGKLNKQIAGDLGIAEKTVKVHRARVMQKLDVVSVADLVRLAEKANSLFSDPQSGDAQPT